ncbi:MAG: flagellar export chaperone FliS [Lachnospiraceae bacterium]|nr:flagellar export chaperone FliS [Lachnospiraceae bacterium]MDE7332498.1 flagellar export chaperone FliS [Lachnospiraceae bacterium]
MALPNAFAQYKNSKVLTASPAELTLMLYEGAIKFCNVAIAAIDGREIQKAHINIIKAQKIVEHLQVTLDMKYPVAKDFDRIYNYLLERLVDANIKKDKAAVVEVRDHLNAVRDTWKEVMRINNRERGTV